jgi:formate hydrogenlyase subunit 3/multisubunit Na+/H+ antiporter MnhD subunit
MLEKAVLYIALVIGALVLIGFGTKAGLQPTRGAR